MASNRVWRPVPDGEYIMPLWDDKTYTLCVSDNGESLDAWGNADSNKYKDGTPKHVEGLGVGDYRLCELVDAPAAVTIPDEVREAIALVLGHAEHCYDLEPEPEEFETVRAWLDEQRRRTGLGGQT